MTGAINKLMLANTFTPNFTIGLIFFILPSPFMNETSTYFSIASLQNFQLQTNLITNVIKLLCSKFFLNSKGLFAHSCSFENGNTSQKNKKIEHETKVRNTFISCFKNE